MTAAERIRQKMLGAQARETFVEVDGQTYLLVAPSVRQASRILQRAMGDLSKAAEGGEVTIDQAELQVQALIECLRAEDTKEPVFAQTDRVALLDGALSLEFMQLGRAAAQLINPASQVTAKKKPSEEIQSA